MRSLISSFFLAFLIATQALGAQTTFQTDTAKLGRPNTNNKDFIFDINAGASNPVLRADGTAGKLKFSNDGTNYSLLGSGSGSAGGVNILTNGDFESGSVTTGWSATGGATAAVTSGANLLFGTQSASFTASASSQIYETTATAIPNGLLNSNCYAEIYFKYASGAAGDYSLRIDDGAGNLLAAAVLLPVATTAQLASINFPCGSGNARLQIFSNVSSPSAIIVDNAYVGSPKNIGTAPIITSWATGLTFTTNNLGTTTPTSPVMYWRQVGDSMEVYSSFAMGTGAGSPASIQFPAGYVIDTTKFPSSAAGLALGDATVALSSSTTIGFGTGKEVLFYDGSTNNQLFFAEKTGSNALTKDNGSSVGSSGFVITVHFTVPIVSFNANGVAVRADSTPASWSGYQTVASGWNTSSGTFADLSAGTTIVLTQVTNRNFGTVSSAGSSLPGISANLPALGMYNVCATATSEATSGGTSGSLRLVDGSGTIINPGMSIYYDAASSARNVTVCGFYNALSIASATTFKLQMATNASNVNIYNLTSISGTAAIQWTVTQLDAGKSTPYLVNSVTSNSSGIERIDRARILNSGTVSIASQSGSWLSVVRNSTGNLTLTFTAGEFSVAPACVCSSEGGTGHVCAFNGAVTSTSAPLLTSLTTTLSDDNFDLVCIGAH